MRRAALSTIRNNGRMNNGGGCFHYDAYYDATTAPLGTVKALTFTGTIPDWTANGIYVSCWVRLPSAIPNGSAFPLFDFRNDDGSKKCTLSLIRGATDFVKLEAGASYWAAQILAPGMFADAWKHFQFMAKSNGGGSFSSFAQSNGVTRSFGLQFYTAETDMAITSGGILGYPSGGTLQGFDTYRTAYPSWGVADLNVIFNSFGALGDFTQRYNSGYVEPPLDGSMTLNSVKTMPHIWIPRCLGYRVGSFGSLRLKPEILTPQSVYTLSGTLSGDIIDYGATIGGPGGSWIR